MCPSRRASSGRGRGRRRRSPRSETSGAVDAPLPSPDALIRPWRTATLVASLVAAIELVLLVGAALLLLAKPLAHAVQRHAEAAALAPAAPVKKAHAIVRKTKHVPPAKHLRSHTGVFVLNGNGRNG